MSKKGEAIPLADRESAYQDAEASAIAAAAAYLEARAGARLTGAVIGEMDRAQAELRRAKRRFEEAVRREAKRSRGAMADSPARPADTSSTPSPTLSEALPPRGGPHAGSASLRVGKETRE